MKKQLTENSFQSIIDGMTLEDLKKYLEEEGDLYYSEDVDVPVEGGTKTTSGWVWARKHPIEYDYNILTHEELLELKLADWLRRIEEEGAPGTTGNSLSIEAYNNFARCDVWHGGYVEGYGYIGVAASSLYGNSLCLNGSWCECGSQSNPVTAAKFYKLMLENRWKGGYVRSWNYVSANTKILGSSLDLERVSPSEVTLGSIINVGNSLGRNMHISTLRERFKDYWDEMRKKYEIDDKTLSEFFRTTFYHAVVGGIRDGLAQHKPIFLRIVDRKVNDYGEITRYGTDYMVVDYNEIRRTYECIEPITPSVVSVSVKNIQEGKTEILTYIFSKS